MKTGIANLPLHRGYVPRWLFDRMKNLAREIIIVIISEFGQEVLLSRLSDPFWFQALGCTLGFDWHSSGLSTVTCSVLKEAVKGLENDLGFFVCGGKGKISRKTPQEIKSFAEKYSIKRNPNELIYASKMCAKVDTCGVQDGYQLYHHTFFFTKEGEWAVVQQGMSENSSWARRYHWLADSNLDFVCEPHQGICSDKKGQAMNLVAKESHSSQKVISELSCEKPNRIVKDLKKLQRLDLDENHQFFLKDLRPDSIERVLLKSYEQKPKDFEALLSISGIGPKTIRALALISELIWGEKISYKDPAKFSFAHGGKDGYPYPVNKKRMDQSIEILKLAFEKAKINDREKIEAIKRLKNY